MIKIVAASFTLPILSFRVKQCLFVGDDSYLGLAIFHLLADKPAFE